MGHFIDDGMQVSANVAGRTGLYDSLAFEYRPPTSRDIATHQGKLRGAKTDEETDDLQKQFLAKHLVSWSASAPVSVDNLHRLHATLFDRIYATVTDTSNENNNVIREGN